jgi:hypothetical protein
MAKKAENKEKKQRASRAEVAHAEYLYCERKYTCEAVAEALDRDIKTVFRWRDEGKWEETRELFDTGPTALKKILIKEATRIARGEERVDANGDKLPGIDADALSKIMKAYEQMSKKASPAVVFEVLKELDTFLCGINPQLAAEMTKYHKLFLQHRIKSE